jgi:membrane fusion protein (multidrug efflux system)
VDVRSKVPGRIESLSVDTEDGGTIPVEEGLQVKKGQQICVIDHDAYLAEVAAAEAVLKTREIELADANREKNRMIALYQGGSATEQNRDKAVTAYEMAESNLKLANANLELARINLRESKIVSPIDGIVTARHVDAGNLIKVGDPIITISDMNIVKVIVPVAERFGKNLHQGMPVRISVDTYPDRQFEANVYSVYPALDVETHTIQVEIRIKNSDLLLKPGMFARVVLVTDSRDNAVVVGRDLVLGGKIDKPYVYVVNDSTAHKRIVEIGITQGDKYEITKGLNADETIVTNGMTFLQDGTSVDVVELEEIK